ncbi:MAG: phosphatase domain-containing protein [Bacteroidota bacterium]|nr:phosphatase domain-containing protein [Bacteroidota bacterium]
MNRKKILKKILKPITRPFKWLKLYVKQRMGWLGVPVILPFDSYGNKSGVFIRGMLTEDKGIARPRSGQSKWTNMLAMIKRFSGEGIPGVDIQVECLGHRKVVETDEYGIFAAEFNNIEIPQNKIHLKFKAELMDELVEKQPRIIAGGDIHLPGKNANTLVVSDIDDTIIVSHASKIIRKLRLLLFRNALTRVAFPGATAFYEALREGRGEENNPFFYVSSSEWNLYDMLRDFFEFNNFPPGVLLLRTMKIKGIKLLFSGKGKHEHKIEKIEHLLKIYPGLDFILIGDSGQKDPEIYYHIMKKHPDRIKAAYIRHIRVGFREKRFLELSNDLKKTGKDMLLVGSSLEAAKHAALNAYIKKSSLKHIASQKSRQESE